MADKKESAAALKALGKEVAAAQKSVAAVGKAADRLQVKLEKATAAHEKKFGGA